MRALPIRSRSVRDRTRPMVGAALLGVALLGLAGCSATEPRPASTKDGDSGTIAPPPPPPPPPAACLLDLDALAGTTGLSWTADATTASDFRCVYDPGPAGPSAGPTAAADGGGTGLPTQPVPAEGVGAGEFVAVDITPVDDRPVAAQLDVVAQVCDEGSRAPVGTGFVCRFGGGSVYAGLVRGQDIVTVAASGVPAGTTAAALTMAIGQQVDVLS